VRLLVVNLVEDSPSPHGVPKRMSQWLFVHGNWPSRVHSLPNHGSKMFKTCQGAREQGDSYAFAFECLLGDLALRLPCAHREVMESRCCEAG